MSKLVSMSERLVAFNNVKNFIRDNPYPAYRDMLEMIFTRIREELQDASEEKKMEAIELVYDYKQHNHIWMKEIYENITNDKLIKKNGELINEKGGMWSMISSYSILRDFLNIRVKELKLDREKAIDIFYPITKQISVCWTGVGDWRD